APAHGERSGGKAGCYGLWGRGFRPFFLGMALYTLVVIPWWTASWLAGVPAPGWPGAIQWHGHEMLFGFVAAGIAGFLLTASPTWAGRRALCGRPLAALFGLWVAGRVAFALAGFLPVWVVAAVDFVFLPCVAFVVGWTLRGSGQYRNYGVVAVVSGLALANALVHADALGVAHGWSGRALRLAVDGIVVLILVISGRITPAFTRNAFRREGLAYEVRSPLALHAVAITAALALAVVGSAMQRSAATGVLATIAGLAAAARMVGWQSWHTRRDPLLWSLHAGVAWLVVGLLLVAAGDLGAPIPVAAGLHALTAGAMGTMLIAVMTRVALGHTGRPLALPTGMVQAYLLVHLAALARVAGALVVEPGLNRALILLAGLAWAGGFGLFALRYGPMLVRPRVDGRPG
ncbi:MAG: NnrS family protein, partial [Deltaproteobacteria bacterium]|nr:NnrS family protein [Deltaproteobacteria bacterium]